MHTTPPTIVVVDDDPEIIAFICDSFTMLGMTVIPCHDDSDALACITEHQPSVIILDMHLQDVTGIDMLHLLRADPTTRAIPVVFFTGSGDELRQLLPDYAAHNAQLVTKPNVEQLSVVVQRLVQGLT